MFLSKRLDCSRKRVNELHESIRAGRKPPIIQYDQIVPISAYHREELGIAAFSCAMPRHPYSMNVPIGTPLFGMFVNKELKKLSYSQIDVSP
jgi:hypothetical protein